MVLMNGPVTIRFKSVLRHKSPRAPMNEDDPLPLREACNLYPQARLTVSTLRAEHGRGRLAIFRLGKRDYTTPRSMREMVRRCQDDASRPASTLTAPGSNGLSAMDNATSALDALKLTATKLRQSSANTLAKRASRKVDQTR